MLGQILLLAGVGAAAGWALGRVRELRLDPGRAIALGAVGAVLAGFALKVLLPLAVSVLGAAAGALLAIWLAERHGASLLSGTARRRRD